MNNENSNGLEVMGGRLWVFGGYDEALDYSRQQVGCPGHADMLITIPLGPDDLEGTQQDC